MFVHAEGRGDAFRLLRHLVERRVHVARLFAQRIAQPLDTVLHAIRRAGQLAAMPVERLHGRIDARHRRFADVAQVIGPGDQDIAQLAPTRQLSVHGIAHLAALARQGLAGFGRASADRGGAGSQVFAAATQHFGHFAHGFGRCLARVFEDFDFPLDGIAHVGQLRQRLFRGVA